MAWIYLPASVESALHSQSGSDPLPTVRLTSTASASCKPDSQTVHFQTRQSGTTLQRSEEAICQSSQILSMADSHVRTLAMQDLEQAWQESEAGFSLKSSACLARLDRASCSWRTSQLSLFEEPITSELNWPRSGMIVAGRLYRLQALAHHIKGIGGGVWPTPLASDAQNSLYTRKECQEKGYAYMLIRAVAETESRKWPTPTAGDTYLGAASGGRIKNPSLARKIYNELSAEIGKLNPMWIEWLMGYPIGWTACEPLETQ